MDAIPVGAVPSLLEALTAVPDPHRRRGRRYPAAVVLTLAGCVLLRGARSLEAIARWGCEHGSAEVRAARGITHAHAQRGDPVPRPGPRRPRAGGRRVAAWQGRAPGEAIALDGKALRGIHGEAVPAVPPRGRLRQRSGLVLAQTGARSGRTS